MRLRRFLIAGGLLGLGLLVLANLGQLPKFWQALREVRWYTIPLVIIFQIASYACQGAYYRAFFAISGRPPSWRKLTEICLAINFANLAIPSGGVAGAAYMAHALRDDAPPGAATLAQVGQYILVFITIIPVMTAGFLLLFLGGDITKISVRITLLVVILIIMLVGGLLLLLSERHRLEQVAKQAVHAINNIGQILSGHHKELIDARKLTTFLDEFYEAYQEIMRRKDHWGSLIGWILGLNLTEIGTVYVVAVGFGHWLNPGVVILAYLLANIVSVVGVLTSGLGVYEAGMVGALAALGTPFALAFAIVIVYRGLNIGLFIPPGLYYYRKYL